MLGMRISVEGSYSFWIMVAKGLGSGPLLLQGLYGFRPSEHWTVELGNRFLDASADFPRMNNQL